MAGEHVRDAGAWVDLEANGAAITNNSFGAADDAGIDLAAQSIWRPHLEFELQCTYTSAPTANAPIGLHHSPQDLFGGSTDGGTPSANNLGGLLTSVSVENTTALQQWRFDVMFAPTHSKYWLQNAGTNQTIPAGWKLRCRTWTLKPA